MKSTNVSGDLLPAEPSKVLVEYLHSSVPKEQHRLLLQEWFGYCMTDDNGFGRALHIVGPPRSGKSVAVRALGSLLGHEKTAGLSVHNFASSWKHITRMKRQLCVFNDSPAFDKLPRDFTRLAQIIRGAVPDVTSRLVFVSCNEAPALYSTLDHRLMTVRMQTIACCDVDTRLAEKLHADLRGVFAWALAGLLRLQTQEHFTGYSR